MESGIEVREVAGNWSLADLDALIGGEQTEHKQGGVTMRELLESTGKCSEVITTRLHRLKAAGKLSVGREYREGIDGLMHVTTVYYIGG